MKTDKYGHCPICRQHVRLGQGNRVLAHFTRFGMRPSGERERCIGQKRRVEPFEGKVALRRGVMVNE